MGCGTNFDMNVDFCTFVPDNDHSKLKNRDLDDQHPISAITGLKDALEKIDPSQVFEELEVVVDALITNFYDTPEEVKTNLGKALNEIQSTIDTIFIPDGIYNLGSESIKLQDNKSLVFGKNAIVNYSATSNDFKLFEVNGVNNVSINGGKFINDSLEKLGTAFYLCDCQNCKILNAYIENNNIGITVKTDEKYTTQNRISGCYIKNINTGILLTAAVKDISKQLDNTNIDHCVIRNDLVNNEVPLNTYGISAEDIRAGNGFALISNNHADYVRTENIVVSFSAGCGINPLFVTNGSVSLDDLEDGSAVSKPEGFLYYNYNPNYNKTYSKYDKNGFENCIFTLLDDVYSKYIYVSDYSKFSGNANISDNYISVDKSLKAYYGEDFKYFDSISDIIRVSSNNYSYNNYEAINLGIYAGNDRVFEAQNNFDYNNEYDTIDVHLNNLLSLHLDYNDSSKNYMLLSDASFKIFDESIIFKTSSDELILKNNNGILNYNDKDLAFKVDIPAINTASKTQKGIVQIGDNINVTDDGTLSVSKATKDILGLVKIGSGIILANDGTISVEVFVLEPATSSKLGGVKIGSGVNVTSDGTISVDSYTLPIASSSVLGGLQIGYTESDKNYAVKLDDNNKAYVSVPQASDSTSGVVKVGSNINIQDGVINVSEATSESLGLVKVGSGIDINDGIISITTLDCGSFSDVIVSDLEKSTVSQLESKTVSEVES